MLQVRVMEKKDLDRIVEIENESFVSPWSKDNFIQELTQNPFAYYFVLVNKDNEEILGYVGFWIKFEFSEITKIAIAKKYRGLHLSKILMEDMIKRVTLANCENITLEVRVSNTKAIRLYESFDFKEITIRKKYYNDGEDAILMERKIIEEGN